jgi:mRNA interferase YafQ
MYNLAFTGKFKKDFKLAEKRRFTIARLEEIFLHLEHTGSVPQVFKPHKLSGKYSDCWECHIESDWLLIWRVVEEKTIELVRTGTHSDLF